MQTLTTLPARTTKQMLRRLHEHYVGRPIEPGHPLAGIARALPGLDRSVEIVFLTRKNSVWVQHVILVQDDRVVLDHNTYLTGRFEDGVYHAVALGGRVEKLEPRRRISIEQFIDETGLHFTLAKRVRRDQSETSKLARRR